MDDIRAFASVAGNVNPGEAQVIGYKVRPPGAMCNIDGQVTECGGTGSALVLTAYDKDRNIDVNGIQQSILAWMGPDW